MILIDSKPVDDQQSLRDVLRDIDGEDELLGDIDEHDGAGVYRGTVIIEYFQSGGEDTDWDAEFSGVTDLVKVMGTDIKHENILIYDLVGLPEGQRIKDIIHQFKTEGIVTWCSAASGNYAGKNLTNAPIIANKDDVTDFKFIDTVDDKYIKE